ncbi:MAG: hypothetical protein CMJ81_19170 [Planctomycetaceae bacterium]|nr:hypothetical protein [Planctomycetaceae bacterium]
MVVRGYSVELCLDLCATRQEKVESLSAEELASFSLKSSQNENSHFFLSAHTPYDVFRNIAGDAFGNRWKLG